MTATTDRVRVRLVPKSDQKDAITFELRELTPAAAKRLAPSEGRAIAAQRKAVANLHMSATVSAGNVVDGSIAKDQFQQVFGTALVSKSKTTTRPKHWRHRLTRIRTSLPTLGDGTLIRNRWRR